MPEKAIIVGAGNVAWHLAPALDKAGIQIDQVIARHPDHAKELAEKFGAYFGTDPVAGSHADWVFICTGDDQIALAATQLRYTADIMVHTSGSVDLEILKDKNRCYGVMYPLQTFSKQRPLNFQEVPLLIESADPATEQTLRQLAEKLSFSVHFADSKQRSTIHLAAVFANNFVNHMMQLSSQISEASNLPPQLLNPLFRETVQKAIALGPLDAQTGPARRGDWHVIENHLKRLQTEHPEMAELYRIVSNSIAHQNK